MDAYGCRSNSETARMDAGSVVKFATFSRALTLLLQVLTRFLASSSPVLYWFSAHLLQKHEPLYSAEKATSSTQSCTHRAACKTGSEWRILPQNPLSELLWNWAHCCAVTKCLLGWYLSYWVLGLLLHCNCLPWT
ncbi:palmitoyltransferase ZDHHC18-A isoform X2 [Polyodon spathula]|uniref:palmitoyltransferase ZDHHC18-A isoform X2 n=1 Tax=Polyodon spathula TaxID=7913 RepID=UPI001B7E059F|nr:palmitoyltransferase ZDHHC18-A isoform X2 [Polyodon spathula]